MRVIVWWRTFYAWLCSMWSDPLKFWEEYETFDPFEICSKMVNNFPCRNECCRMNFDLVFHVNYWGCISCQWCKMNESFIFDHKSNMENDIKILSLYYIWFHQWFEKATKLPAISLAGTAFIAKVSLKLTLKCQVQLQDKVWGNGLFIYTSNINITENYIN